MLISFEGAHPRLQQAFVAPGAVVIGDVACGPDCSFWYGAVVRGDVMPIRLGARVNVQDGAVLHVTAGTHATRLGDDVTVGHRAIVHGCTLGDRVLVGMGAIVMDGACIEEDCLVGAGAIVTPGARVPAGSLVVGAPARVVRPLGPGELAALIASASHYVETARRHAASGGPDHG